MRAPFPTCCLLACGLLLGTVTVSAQDASAELRGFVRAAETAEPLAGAQLLLPELDRGSETDGEGRFRLRELPPGVYALEVRYLGRVSGAIEVELRTARVTSLELALEIEPVEVPELRVEVERRWRAGKMAGFYERMEQGVGRFITREEIEATPGSELHSVFRRVPNVRISRCPSGTVGCYLLTSGRAMPSFQQAPGERCLPEYYLDGTRVPLNELPLGINEIAADDVEAIEVYSGPGPLPVQYSGSRARCGVVLIWAR